MLIFRRGHVMNRNRILCTFVAIACLGLAWKPSMQPASAATFMWNVSSGTWDTSSTNWSGATGPTLWDSVTGGTNTADFTASGATATIGTGAAVYTNGIIFDSPAWITGGTMHLAGTTPAITVNATGGTIASVLAGTGGLVENGTGVLTLTASNFYSGTTAINGGTIAVSNVGALGTSSVALAGGAMLNVNFISATPTLTNPISVAAGQSGFFNVIGSGAAGNNTVTIAGSAALNINGDLLVSRNAGSPGATNFSDLITGSGTLEVGNTNAGIAPMAVSGSQGRCTFTNSGAFTNFTGTIHVDNGANLLFNPSPANQSTTTQTLTINSGGYATVLGGTTTAFGALNGSGTVTTNAASTIATLSIGNSGGSGTFTGVIAQNVLLGTAPVSLLKNGAGLEVLAGPSSYTRGTTISGGTLQIGAGGTTGSLSNSTTSVNTLTDNATLTFNRSDTITQGTQFSPNGITGNGSLVQLGPGTLVLNAANTYMGNTTVSGGTLQIGNGGSLNTAGLIAVNSGATLAFNRSDTPTQGTDFSSSGIGGAGGLAQIGTGTLILNASNTYSGPTTVSAGALQVDGTIAQTSAISVSTAGTLAGSGLIGGNSSPTTLTGGATVNLSGGTIGGPLNVTGGNWTGTGTVNGLVTASSNVFTVANGSSLNTAGNMNLSGGTLTGQGDDFRRHVDPRQRRGDRPRQHGQYQQHRHVDLAQPRHGRRRHAQLRPLQRQHAGRRRQRPDPGRRQRFAWRHHHAGDLSHRRQSRHGQSLYALHLRRQAQPKRHAGLRARFDRRSANGVLQLRQRQQQRGDHDDLRLQRQPDLDRHEFDDVGQQHQPQALDQSHQPLGRLLRIGRPGYLR